MVTAEIRSAIEKIESDVSLYDETGFNDRANAIDFIDFHVIDRIDGLLENILQQQELHLQKQRAEQLKHNLEAIDTKLFKQLREYISDGVYSGLTFKAMVSKYVNWDSNDIDQQQKIGYDNLDIFINGLLCTQPLPETTITPAAEMVFYQQTPARIIFQMAEQADLSFGDVFFDIGSGLGQVSILINLFSGAKTIGIEYEPAYCVYANTCARQLNLAGVKFIKTDAREVDYSCGTVFFMYTPFEGGVLQEMLDILRKQSEKRPIRIFTYGPCSASIVQQKWLECVNGAGNDIYKLYEFRSLVTPNA